MTFLFNWSVKVIERKRRNLLWSAGSSWSQFSQSGKIEMWVHLNHIETKNHPWLDYTHYTRGSSTSNQHKKHYFPKSIQELGSTMAYIYIACGGKLIQMLCLIVICYDIFACLASYVGLFSICSEMLQFILLQIHVIYKPWAKKGGFLFLYIISISCQHPGTA